MVLVHLSGQNFPTESFIAPTADLSARLHRKQLPGSDDALPWLRSIPATWYAGAFVNGRDSARWAGADKSALGTLKRPLRLFITNLL